jgi:hypothetical protein
MIYAVSESDVFNAIVARRLPRMGIIDPFLTLLTGSLPASRFGTPSVAK